VLRDRGLQFFHVNEEFPVSASHQLALITSLPFVHTARRYYRLNDRSEVFGLDARYSAPPGAGSSRDREDDRTRPFRGSKSRNKVSVGEPAEGSLETGPRRRRTRAGLARASSDRVAASARPTHVDDRPRAATPDRASTERWLPSKDQSPARATDRSRPRRRTVSSHNEKQNKNTRPRTADHLARGSMKTAAICASSCNPQVIRTSTSRTHIAASVTRGSRATPV
jgi:hypothetical protein